eukprot:CAMPEP_0174972900 /NCGR_PEP_ID=MMETSP0004_2-20121128/10909_1 /TAXON_ID=420556 /ORGANISM="Ochromonas sp., Strain CCMP1393" /LENGTH=377 /DNA_ID=CAMNT_0016223221 /DNA_START=169 /DNA_END=1302 /DNA_ORIENTATION=+
MESHGIVDNLNTLAWIFKNDFVFEALRSPAVPICINSDQDKKKLCVQLLQYLQNHGANVKYLDCLDKGSFCQHNLDVVHEAVVNHCKNLEVLGPTIYFDEKIDTLHHLPCLKQMTFRANDFDTFFLETVQEIFKGCENQLHSLDLEGVVNVATATSILHSNNQLRDLTILISSINSAVELFTLLGQCCPLLESLHVSTYMYSGPLITADHLQELVRGCPRIRKLTLRFGALAADAVDLLLDRFHHLEDLFMLTSTSMTDDLMRSLATSSKRNLTNQAISCGGIRSLCLAGCPHVTDAGLVALADGAPNLEVIKISHNEHMTGAGLLELARKCPKLHTVSLSNVRNVTPVVDDIMTQQYGITRDDNVERCCFLQPNIF